MLMVPGSAATLPGVVQVAEAVAAPLALNVSGLGSVHKLPFWSWAAAPVMVALGAPVSDRTAVE
jgi:hypothetical protein